MISRLLAFPILATLSRFSGEINSSSCMKVDLHRKLSFSSVITKLGLSIDARKVAVAFGSFFKALPIVEILATLSFFLLKETLPVELVTLLMP